MSGSSARLKLDSTAWQIQSLIQLNVDKHLDWDKWTEFEVSTLDLGWRRDEVT